jgi:hypothetical protein
MRQALRRLRQRMPRQRLRQFDRVLDREARHLLAAGDEPRRVVAALRPA